ncbi:AAA family ATPase [Arthrobacter sp. LAPM80]|uniref:AAA family ATPase n=1 Tax=Arthrobacter sp. LAPM80 TaxID=3141788 RepID=UPI00398AC6B7
MLSACDSLPELPQRILVAGVSGSGKTTLAARIAAVLGVPHTEIDSLFHGPDWTPRESFEHDVEQFSGTATWTTEWQYNPVRDMLAERADTLIWLDFPTALTLSRLIRRTVRRRLRREELWNGNLEAPLHSIFFDPDHIIRWGWQTRNLYRSRIPALRQSHPGLRIVRLRRQRDVETWVKNLSTTVATGRKAQP